MVRAEAQKWTFHVQVLNNVQKLQYLLEKTIRLIYDIPYILYFEIINGKGQEI